MAFKTITLKGEGVAVEALAAGTITPGMLIEWTSSTKFVAHNSAGENASPMFAIENQLEGEGISDNYSAGERVFARIFRPGDEVYAVCAASQTLAVGDLVESNGAGALQAHVPASAGAPLEYPESVVGIVKVAVTTGSATGRVIVEIL